MTSELDETLRATRQKYHLDAAQARVQFSTRSALTAGLRSDVRIRDHAMIVDEPPQIGGGDAGPTPVELVLAALGACQEITYKAYATALGIPLDRVAVTLVGDIDLRGFFGVDETVRPGYLNIHGTVEIDSSAPRADLERLKAVVDRHCPVLDMLTTPVPITLELAATATPRR